MSATSCVTTDTTTCGDLVCPSGSICIADRNICVRPDQTTACQGLSNGDVCTFPGVNEAFCSDGLCLRASCGDGQVVGLEECEGDNTGAMSCTDLGFYDEPGLACTAECTFDVAACTGFCGDGMQNGDELCDDSPPGLSCTGLGLDFGVPGCQLCAPDLNACGPEGTWTEFDATQVGVAELDVSGVWGRGASEVYFPGASGKLVRYDGTDFELLQLKTSLNIGPMWGTADELFFISEGLLWRIDESTLEVSLVETFSSERLLSLAPGSPTAVGVAVGDADTVVVFDGQRWGPMRTREDGILISASIARGFLGIAGGGAAQFLITGDNFP